MRILFDQGTPVPLRRSLAAHEVATAWQRGWAQLSNGDLLAAAEADGFDLLVTTDQNLRYQQNLAARRIAMLVLTVANWPTLEPHATEIALTVDLSKSYTSKRLLLAGALGYSGVANAKKEELSYQQAWMTFRTWERRLRFSPLRWLIPGSIKNEQSGL